VRLNKPPEVLKQIENETSVSFGVAEKKPLINIYLSEVCEHFVAVGAGFEPAQGG